MAETRSLTRISEADYEAIESAVMETERGRWFLREYANRNRHADTEVLLEAIARLERAVSADRAADSIDRFRFDLTEMAKAIARSKMEIASIRPADQQHSQLMVASEALDAITRTTEQATSDILAAAEHIQETAWTLREDGADPDLCDNLDRRATEIYTACSFQDLTAQRTSKIVHTLRYLENRINAMIGIWGSDAGDTPPTAPAPLSSRSESLDLSQRDVDDVIVQGELVERSPAEHSPEEIAPAEECPWTDPAGQGEAAPEAEFESAGEFQPEGAFEPEDECEAGGEPEFQGEAERELAPILRAEALAEIDALPVPDKLSRFT